MAKTFPQRKSPRLKGYDYSQPGAYFVTIRAHEGKHLFGQMIDGDMQLNPIGEIASAALPRIPDYWDNVEIDAFVVMPNHVHAIVVITDAPEPSPDTQQSSPKKARRPTLGHIVGSYKAGVTRTIRQQGLADDDVPIWHGRYHDHIIRKETDLHRIRQYIADNPARWPCDTFYKSD